jgi:hypothetical protein
MPSTIEKFNKVNQEFAPKMQNILKTNQYLLENITEAYTLEETRRSVEKANQKLAKKYNIVFNPKKDESIAKFFAGCTQCNTLTDIVVRICESYGCIADKFVTRIETDDCNSQLVTTINGIVKETTGANSAGIQSSGADTYQRMFANTQQDLCMKMDLFSSNLEVKITQEALCRCTSFDAFVVGAEKLAKQYQYIFDTSILYGAWNGTAWVNNVAPYTTGFGNANSNFQSINPNITANTVTGVGTNEIYKEIRNMVVKIKASGNCGDVQVAMTSALVTAMLGAIDISGRPYFSEIKESGTTCSSLVLFCDVPVVVCDSLWTRTVSSVTSTDVFVGSKQHYQFAHFMFADAEMIKEQNTTSYLLQSSHKVGGKLIDNTKFGKITVTL